MARYCLFCGEQLPENSRRTYCRTQCRRDAQNERRKDERAEARELREAERARTMGDPFDPDIIERMDFWEAAEIYGNMLLDPIPAQLVTSYDQIQSVYRRLQDKELAHPARLRQGWLM